MHARLAFAIPALTMAVFAQKPTIRTGGVVNAASYVGGDPGVFAPQMLVSILGDHLAAATSVAGAFPLPLALGGASVAFNGIPAPLLYVSPKQINAQVPSGVALAGAQQPVNVSVVVTTAAGSSDPSIIVIGGSAIGVFTQDASGCGQAAALNIRADGTLRLNTTQESFDPETDIGLAIFGTGIGPREDRLDGVPWIFNPAGHSSYPAVIIGIPGVSASLQRLNADWAGPAPSLVGVDQVNALLSPNSRLPQGCRVPLFLTDFRSTASQLVNISVRNGGGACLEPPADTLALASWSRLVVSDAGSSSSSVAVEIQFLSGAGIGFQRPPDGVETGSLQPLPAPCNASSPAALDAGALRVSGPGFGPLAVEPQNRNGRITYETALPAGSLTGGAYRIVAQGESGVGAFDSSVQIPPPITITTDLRPGVALGVLRLDWTGGDARSVVTAQVRFRSSVGPPNEFLQATATVPASQGSLLMGAVPFGIVAPPFAATDVELIVTQQPAASARQTFQAPALTLGGEQTWKYVFDFRALKP